MQGEVEIVNNYKVEIMKDGKWVDYTQYAVFPLKEGRFLDEQLDEGNLSLKRIKDDYFNPLTKIKLTYINYPEAVFSANQIEEIKNRSNDETVSIEVIDGRIKQTQEKVYIIANDKATEVPNGSGRYNHDIYFIELTKIAEGFIVDNLT